MSKYLVDNEKWLKPAGTEEGGQYQTDGTLTNDEVSIFFSSGHLQFDPDSSTNGDEFISNEEFDGWYEANKEAISAFLDKEQYGISYEDARDDVYNAVVEWHKIIHHTMLWII